VSEETPVPLGPCGTVNRAVVGGVAGSATSPPPAVAGQGQNRRSGRFNAMAGERVTRLTGDYT
jgi:hypothetical protein